MANGDSLYRIQLLLLDCRNLLNANMKVEAMRNLDDVIMEVTKLIGEPSLKDYLETPAKPKPKKADQQEFANWTHIKGSIHGPREG